LWRIIWRRTVARTIIPARLWFVDLVAKAILPAVSCRPLHLHWPSWCQPRKQTLSDALSPKRNNRGTGTYKLGINQIGEERFRRVRVSLMWLIGWVATPLRSRLPDPTPFLDVPAGKDRTNTPDGWLPSPSHDKAYPPDVIFCSAVASSLMMVVVGRAECSCRLEIGRPGDGRLLLCALGSESITSRCRPYNSRLPQLGRSDTCHNQAISPESSLILQVHGSKATKTSRQQFPQRR